MIVSEAFANVSRLFLDTAPVIYFVEENPDFSPPVNVLFERIENGAIVGITSPVTLAECLVVPYRQRDIETQQQFIDLITNTENISCVEIANEAGQQAAKLRAKYNLQLPDSLQVAVAIVTGCDAIFTNDAAFERITELQVLLLSKLALY
jgi:predicted nucleic acid-binding protein